MLNEQLKAKIPELLELTKWLLGGCPAALTSMLSYIKAEISDVEQLRDIFLEYLHEATKQDLQVKIVYESEQDYYFYLCYLPKNINQRFDKVFAKYIEKFKKDPGFWRPVFDAMIKPKYKLIKLINDAIKRGTPLGYNEIYDSAYKHNKSIYFK